MLERLFAYAIIAGARAVTGLRSLWIGTTPTPAQRIYYANHSSHGDFVLLWASLPPELRARTRPVAGMDLRRAMRYRYLGWRQRFKNASKYRPTRLWPYFAACSL